MSVNIFGLAPFIAQPGNVTRTRYSHLNRMMSLVHWAAQKALHLHRNSTVIVLLLVHVLIFVV